MADNLRALEQTCLQHGVRLELLLHDHENDSWYLNTRQIRPDKEFFDRGSFLGTIIWDIGVSPRYLVHTCTPFARTGRRVVVLEEGGNVDLFRRQYPSFAVLLMGTSRCCGLHAGRYLTRIGHRAIAYLAPVHMQPHMQWSQERLAGLVQGVAEFGLPQARVYPFTDSLEHFYSTPDSIITLCTQTLFPLLHERITRCAEAGGVHGSTRSYNDHQIIDIAATEDLYHRSIPLLKKALACAGCTAWVCQNDTIALAALRFLHEERVPVPAHISVLGFDNSPASWGHRLTSYCYHPEQVARLSLSALLGSRAQWQELHASTPFEVEGHIVERATVAPHTDHLQATAGAPGPWYAQQVHLF